jgi:hypothetical protein
MALAGRRRNVSLKRGADKKSEVALSRAAKDYLGGEPLKVYHRWLAPTIVSLTFLPTDLFRYLYTPGGLNQALISGLGIFFVVHLFLHLAYPKYPKNEFKSVFSWVLIVGRLGRLWCRGPK